MTATIKFKPGKRIKSLHRAAKKEGVTNSLRSFARSLLKLDGFDEVARRWAGGKVAR